MISLPELARHNDNRAKLAARLGDLTHVAAVVTFPALAVLGACARPFVLVLGEQWAQAVQPLRVLCAVSAVGAVYDLIGPALQAAQRAAVPAIFTWVSAATYAAGFLAAVWLSSSLGTIGRITAIAWAVLAMRVVLTVVLGYIAYRRILRVSAWPSVLAALPAVLASAVAVAVATGVQDLLGTHARPVVVLILAGGSAALAAAAVLYAVDREVRTMAGRVLARVRQRTASRRGRRAPAPATVLATADEATTVASADCERTAPAVANPTPPPVPPAHPGVPTRAGRWQRLVASRRLRFVPRSLRPPRSLPWPSPRSWSSTTARTASRPGGPPRTVPRPPPRVPLRAPRPD